MSESPPSVAANTASSSLTGTKPAKEPPAKVFLVPYPKIVFLYPTLLVSLVAAIVLSLHHEPLNPEARLPVLISTIFLGVLGVNLVILAFDFPRTTSLTLFFLAVAIVMGCILLFTQKPEILPQVTHILKAFRPLANPAFYWGFSLIVGAIFVAVFIVVRFDYWEVRPNELLHHHGFLSNLERIAAPNLRIDKEINDVFEYALLHSGRLILQSTSERRAIILDNVPFIKEKEEAVTRMLGALQVQVRSDEAAR